MVSAFCALGGTADKTGEIKAEKLREVFQAPNKDKKSRRKSP